MAWPPSTHGDVRQEIERIRGVAAPTGTAATDQPAIQAAIDAAAAAGGGIVQLRRGDYAMNAELILKNRVLLRGEGIRLTRLIWSVDLGADMYAVRQETGAAIQRDAPRVDHLTIKGPVAASLPGGAHAEMDGWRIGRDVHGSLVQVTGFRAGGVIYGDHNTMTECIFTDNYYNLLYHGTPLTKSNQYFIACGFTGAGFASIAIDGTNGIDGSLFVGGHAGFAPFGIYRFDNGANGSLMGNSILDGLSFEAIGNAAIYDAATTTSDSINHSMILNPGFSWSDNNSNGGWGRVLVGQPRDYSVVVRSFGGAYIRGTAAPFPSYNILVGSSFVRLDLEQTTVPTIAGVASNVHLRTNEFGVYYRKASAAVAVRDLLEDTGTDTVAPYGTQGKEFVGVAMAAAALNGWVPVAYEGRVTVNCGATATVGGVLVTPDPAALTKVAPVSSVGSNGYTHGNTSAIPSKHPVIGRVWFSLNANSSGVIWLTGVQPNRTYVTPGAVTALPTASATYRGQMLRVEGATGVADGLYVCMKDAANAYAWKAVTLA